jgi:hypothetical protein
MEKRNFFSNMIENIFGIIFSIVFLQIVNIYYKDIPFLTSDFTKVIPLYNISLGIGITFNILNIILNNLYVKRIFELISNVIFVVLAYNLWILFPFDTSYIGDTHIWDMVFRMLIVLPVFGVVIGSIVNIFKIFTFVRVDTDTKKS